MGFLEWFMKPLKDSPGTPGKSANIREQALANMRAARERIGDEEIEKMATSLREENMKVKAEKARQEILKTDKVLVASRLKNMMRED